MKDFFKPEDFMINGWLEERAEICSVVANEKLNKLIESCPVVYGNENKTSYQWTVRKHHLVDTHKARLAFIEEIVKEPCKHEPSPIDSSRYVSIEKPFCKHCGVDLQATWSAK